MEAKVGKSSNGDCLDLSGKHISVYVLNEVIRQMNDPREEKTIQIKVDSYEALQADLQAWGRITGNPWELIESTEDYMIYRLERGQKPVSRKKFALILSNAGLEELLSPLGFAWAAAVSGREVHIYFQGPAVRILRKGFKEKLKGIGAPFSVFARKGLSSIGHIPPQEKLRELKNLGAKFYVCQPSMDHFKVKKPDLIFPDAILAEYVTFLEIINEADIRFFL